MDTKHIYRAWDIKNKKILGWSEIFSNVDLLRSFFGNEHYLTNPIQYLFKRMQCTGEYDKKGRLIYEGDILLTENKSKAIIKRSNRICGLTLHGYLPTTGNLTNFSYLKSKYIT